MKKEVTIKVEALCNQTKNLTSLCRPNNAASAAAAHAMDLRHATFVIKVVVVAITVLVLVLVIIIMTVVEFGSKRRSRSRSRRRRHLHHRYHLHSPNPKSHTLNTLKKQQQNVCGN